MNILLRNAYSMPVIVAYIIPICLVWRMINPPTPAKNISINTMHAQLRNLVAIGYLFTAIKFLKSFKSFNSSVYDLESDF